MTDQPWPPYWDRSVQIVERPVANPTYPFALWCGEEHRIVNLYETRIEAETAEFVHVNNGGECYRHADRTADNPR